MKFGLIGHPIALSLSPRLFKSAYDGRYPYELIQGEDFDVSYQRFLDDYDGINVTAPFKELANAKADILSEECLLVGAANLLLKTPKGIEAHNSDYLGVRLWLSEILSPISSDVLGYRPDSPAAGCMQTCMIVGCGGAGKAAAAAAASLGMRCILMNRNIERAMSLAEQLKTHGYIAEVAPICSFKEHFRKSDIIIYNIPTAIEEIGQLTDTDFISDRKKHMQEDRKKHMQEDRKKHMQEDRKKHILEANYKNPSFDEKLVKRMKEVNPLIEYVGGKTWLLYQAVTGYEIFTGEKPDLQKMSDVL